MTSAVQVSAGGEPAGRCTVVVAATFTAEPLADVVDFWAAELNLPVDIRFADYGQVFQQLLDPASMMAQNTSGLNVLAVRLEDWDPRSLRRRRRRTILGRRWTISPRRSLRPRSGRAYPCSS